MLLDIVILPPKKLRDRIGKRMSAAGIYPYVYLVDNKKLIPHLSLFHINTSMERVSELSKRIENVLSNYKPIKIRSISFSARKPKNVQVFFWLSSSVALKKMHIEIVENCHNLRKGVMPWTRLDKMSKLIKFYRRKYGVQHLFKFFKPHFTMGFFKSSADTDEVVKMMNRVKFEFLANEVAICEVNEWFQVTKIIKRFRLK